MPTTKQQRNIIEAEEHTPIRRLRAGMKILKP